MKNLDKYRGCLVGGAAGDALGYTVEFFDEGSIFRKYGENGITEYDLINGVAQISDDTQMTLFTANGLLLGRTRGMTRGIMGTYPSYIAFCYKDWLRTQSEAYPLKARSPYSWLVNVPELFNRRAPGNTCISAIESGAKGTVDEPINQSKGCGGIMRVAPIGLYFGGKHYTSDEIDMIGAETAALTHGHELGYIPAAALVHIIHLISHNENISLIEVVKDTKQALLRLFAGKKHLNEQIRLIDRAIELSNKNLDDLEAIRELGQGWVAEETLAIAIYCSLKYSDDFDKALIASVNHSGDSDSTGAVTGNIMGAYLGYKGIPHKYIKNLELKSVIMELADDLYNDCKITEYGSYHDEIWEQKYIEKTYVPNKKRSDEEDKFRLVGRGTEKELKTNIVVFPNFQELKNEIEMLRTEMSMLLLERDELQFVICKNIETEYMLKLGSIEYKAYEAQCAVLRLKRKIELIQAKKNRQEKVILFQIEEMLDNEFEEYQQKLNEQMDKMNDALKRSKAEVLSDEDNKELKKLYRKIVKALHPDINPNVSKAQTQLFDNAVVAYKNGDLGTLRIINEMVGDHSLPEKHQDAMTQLHEEKERLESLLKSIRESIEKIKSEYPYTVKDIIEDPEKIKQKKAELENILEQYQELIEIYKAKIKEILR